MTNDIMDLVSYDEASVSMDVMGQKNKKPVKTGVKFDVRDLNNVDTQRELRRVRHTSLGKRISSKEALSDEEIGAMMSAATTEPTDEMLAYCVTGWDWGGKTLGDIDVGVFDQSAVIAVFNAAPWIKQQVLAKALEITDFGRA